jgi:hemerythrin-like metal-binding protein
MVSKKAYWNAIKVFKMAFVELKNTDLVNIQIIDDEHHQMVSLINQIQVLIELGEFKKAKILFTNLLSVTKKHFITEEKLMKDNNFKGFISHKLEHDRVLNKLNSFDLQSKPNKHVFISEELSNIKKWFFNHLELSDKKLGAFLVEKGLR